MTNRYLKNIDPLVAFVEYVKDTKPYHTKILEVLEEYVHDDAIDITITDDHIFGDPECKIFPCNDCEASIDTEGNWRPEPFCEYNGIELLQPETRDPKTDCLVGYSTKPFGAPGYIPIVSPNQSMTFSEYPALNLDDNTITVPGDYRTYLKEGNKILITLRREDFCNVDKVFYEYDIPPPVDPTEPEPPEPPEPEFYDLILINNFFTGRRGENNLNTTFVCPVGNLAVYVNGVRLNNNDYVQTSTFQFSINENILSDGDIIEARTWTTTSSYKILRHTETYTDVQTEYVTPFDCEMGEMNVYLNGTKLIDNNNFTQTSVRTFILSKPIIPDNNDIIEVETWIADSSIVSVRRNVISYSDVKNDEDFILNFQTEEIGYLDVFNNGTKLIATTDYTQSTKTRFSLVNDVNSFSDIISAETLTLHLNEDTGTLYKLSTGIKSMNNSPGINTSYPLDWNDNYFIVNGNKTNFYKEDMVFYGDGIAYRKKFITIVASYNFEYDQTAVLVYPLISQKDKENIRYIGLIIDDVTRNDYYTIENVEYNGGSIASWPDRDNPNSFVNGDDPYTLVEVKEALPEIPLITQPSCQGIVAFLTPEPIIVERALGYSDYLRYYDFGSPSFEDPEDATEVVEALYQTPDEGYFCAKIAGATKSSFDVNGLHIEGTGTFDIDGLLDSSNVFAGDTFTVKNSPGNVGTYIITDIDYDFDTEITTITVKEMVLDDYEYGTGDADCGTITCYLGSECQEIAFFKIPANVLITNGDSTNIFVQGKRFEVDSGTLKGEYTTHSSRFINGKTHIRTTSTLLNEDKGIDIFDIIEYGENSYGFVAQGDVTYLFEEGGHFNIIDSESNDGFYTVETPGSFILHPGSYNPPVPTQTEIPVHSKIRLTGSRLGKILPFTGGLIKQTIFGFSEYEEWCGDISHTVVKVKFDEDLEILGAMLPLRDHVIAHNLENNDLYGYDMSSATVFMDAKDKEDESMEPIWDEDSILSRSTDEPNPDEYIFWHDQNTAELKRYIEGEWIVLNTDTLWWVRTETVTLNDATTQTFYRELYYKKIYYEPYGGGGELFYKETDWIQDLPNEPKTISPGMELTLPARGNLITMNTYSFIPRLIESEALQGKMVVQHTYEIPPFINENGFEEEVWIGEDIDAGSPTVPDKDLIRVFVNNVPAYYEFVDATEVDDGGETWFEDIVIRIMHPVLHREDNVVVEIYERRNNAVSGSYSTEHNAHVNTFDKTRNSFYHQTVGVYKDLLGTPEEAHGAYVVGGGNFLNRFVNETQFVIHTIAEKRPLLKVQRVKQLPIIAVNREERSFQVEGDYSWLFKEGRICKTMLYRSEHVEFQVFRAVYIAGHTYVEVEPAPDGRPDDYETSLFYDNYVDITKIVNGLITIPCDRTGGVHVGDEIEITNSSAGNDGIYFVDNVTYAFAQDETDIGVSTLITDEGTGARAYLTPPVDKFALAVAYEPAPTEIDLSDYITSTPSVKTDATYFVPTAPVFQNVVNVGIDYFYRGPIRVETDYNGPEDNRSELWTGVQVKAQENKFIVLHTGYKNYDAVTEPPNQEIGNDNPSDKKLGLVHQIKPGNLFKIRFSSGFYGCEDLYKSNDGIYAVKTSTYDDVNSETHLEVITEYDDLPPYGSFTIDDTITDVNGIGGRIRFNGNVMSVIDALSVQKFFIQANTDLISTDPKDNFVTVRNYWYDADNRQTIVDIEENIVGGYNGPASLVDFAFSPGVFFDDQRTLITALTHSRKNIVSTIGQTVFDVPYNIYTDSPSPADDEIDVYFNGVLLEVGVDYTATTGTDITLTQPASLGDIITVSKFGENRTIRTKINRGDLIVSTDLQTSFPFVYTPGDVDVYVNGILLSSNDYNATGEDNIEIFAETYAGDTVTAISYEDLPEDILMVYNKTQWTGGGPTYTLSYVVDNILVFVNGTMLHTDDFDASNGTNITITKPIESDDTVTAIYFDTGDGTSGGSASNLWYDGTLVWEGLSLEDNFAADDKIAKTTIGETMSFKWSGVSTRAVMDIERIDPIRNIILLKGNNVFGIQRGDKVTISGTINNNDTYSVEDALVQNGIPFIRVKETLAYGTVDAVQVVSDIKVKINGILRNKIKAGGEVFINGIVNTAKETSYFKPYSYITFENEIPKGNIKQIWFKERKGKVSNK